MEKEFRNLEEYLISRLREKIKTCEIIQGKTEAINIYKVEKDSEETKKMLAYTKYTTVSFIYAPECLEDTELFEIIDKFLEEKTDVNDIIVVFQRKCYYSVVEYINKGKHVGIVYTL